MISPSQQRIRLRVKNQIKFQISISDTFPASKKSKIKVKKPLIIKDAAISAEISIIILTASLEAPAAANKKKEFSKDRERRSALAVNIKIVSDMYIIINISISLY
jgi:hypothetical protein